MWHPGLLLREAFRNLGPRHAVLAVVTAAMLAICGVATVVSASSVLNQHDGELVRGGPVWWIQADSDGHPVPARICAQLNGQPGVVGAGAVGREQREWHAFAGVRGVTVDVGTPESGLPGRLPSHLEMLLQDQTSPTPGWLPWEWCSTTVRATRIASTHGRQTR